MVPSLSFSFSFSLSLFLKGKEERNKKKDREKQGHPVWHSVSITMLHVSLAPAPPRPHPLALYNFKAPNGVRFPRPIFLRESGSCETLEDSCAPLFCGNQDSRETRKDSGAAFFAAKRSQRITATFQRRTLFVMRSSLWRSDRARDFIILDKSPMKPPRLGEQNFSPILLPSLVPRE